MDLYDLMKAPGKFSDAERRFFAEQAGDRIYVSAVCDLGDASEIPCPSSARRNERETSSFDANDVIALLEEQRCRFSYRDDVIAGHAGAEHLQVPY